MPDMLVQLLKLPPADDLIADLCAKGVIIRRAHPFESEPIREFIAKNFSGGWADEVMPCYARQPISLYIAIRSGKVIGFGAYEATRRNFFGPTGVLESERGSGIGRALLLACMHGLRDMGYAYAIIGGVGPIPFYEKAVGATVIPDSTPGIYTDMLNSMVV